MIFPLTDCEGDGKEGTEVSYSLDWEHGRVGRREGGKKR